MGRPLKSIYFGNRNTDGVAGEGVASVAIASPIAKSYTSDAVATFSDPQIEGGSTATGTVTIDGNGDIAAVVVTSAGSGYTTRPTITISEDGQSDTVLTSGSGGVTVTLTTGTTDAITCNAWVISDTVGRVGDIVKQTGGKTFRVATSVGTSKCKLVTSSTGPEAVGEMTITATRASDHSKYDDGSTFNVAKLTGRLAYDADGHASPWVLGAGNADGETVGISSN
jgi:hypothetical protein